MPRPSHSRFDYLTNYLFIYRYLFIATPWRREGEGGREWRYSREFSTWTLDYNGWLQAWATLPPEKNLRYPRRVPMDVWTGHRNWTTVSLSVVHFVAKSLFPPTMITRLPFLCLMQTTNFARVLSYKSPQAVHISDEKLQEFSLKAVQAFKSHLCKEGYLWKGGHLCKGGHLLSSNEVMHLLSFSILTHKLSLRSPAQGCHYFTRRFMLTYTSSLSKVE
jgi:hypothetical protein